LDSILPDGILPRPREGFGGARGPAEGPPVSNMSEWNTFEFFEELLGEFPRIDAAARACGGYGARLRLAQEGWCRFRPAEDWTDARAREITETLRDVYAPEALLMDGVAAERVTRFAALALGALQGAYSACRISESDLTLGEAHLVGFILMRRDWFEGASAAVPMAA